MYFIESNQQIASNNKVNCKWRKRNFFVHCRVLGKLDLFNKILKVVFLKLAQLILI